jgi:hypothetical protein
MEGNHMYYWTKQSPVQVQFDGVRILERSRTMADMQRTFWKQRRAFGHKESWRDWSGKVWVYKRDKAGEFHHHATYKVDTFKETFAKLRSVNF